MADIGVRLVVLGLAEFRRGIGTAEGDIKGFEGTVRSLSGSAAGIGTTMTNIGNAISGLGRTMSLFVSGPLAILGIGFLNAGIQFEDAFAGIGKVVAGVSVGFDEIAAAAQEKLGITITTMDDAKAAAERLGMAFGDLTPMGAALRQAFIDLGQVIPIPLTELADLGMVVGQLGVPADKLIATTKILAEFAAVTGISANDAANAFLHLGNILEGSALNVIDFTTRAGSAVIALGNQSVSTEAEIMNLATRIAAAGDRANFSTPQLLAWATAISDVGVRAELGGTAVSRAMTEMLLAVQTGGDGLEAFAKISGESVDEFRKNFEEDASGAMLKFVESLKKAFAEGTVTQDMLAAMGLSGVRAIDVMGRLGNITDIFAKRLATANDAWSKATLIQEEFAKRSETVKNMIQILKNTFSELGIIIFDLVKSDLRNLIEGIGNLVEMFVGLPKSVQGTILAIAGIAIAIGPVLLVLGGIISVIGTIITTLAALAAAFVPIVVGVGLAAAAFVLFGPSVIGALQPVIDKVQELIGIITKVPTTLPSIGGGTVADAGRTMPEFGTGDQVVPSTAFPDPTLIDKITEAFNNLKASIVIPPGVTETFNQLRASLMLLGQVGASVLDGLKASFETTLGPSFKALIDSLTALLASFGLNWGDVWNAVKTAVADVAIVIGAIILGIIAVIVGLINAVASGVATFARFWAEAKNAVLDFVSGVIALVGGFVTFWAGVIQVIIGLAQVVGGFFTGSEESVNAGAQAISDGLSKIVTGTIAFFDGLIQIVLSSINIIVNGFIGLVSTVASLVVGFLAGLSSFFGEFWASLTGDSDNALLHVAASFTTLRDNILQNVGDLVASVTGFFQNLYDAIVGHSIVPDMVTGVLASFTDLKTTALQIASDLVTGVIGFFTDLATKAGTILGDLFGGGGKQSVADFDTSGIDSAITAINNLKSALTDAQTSFINTGTAFATMSAAISAQMIIINTNLITVLALMTAEWITFFATLVASTTTAFAVLVALWDSTLLLVLTNTTLTLDMVNLSFADFQANVQQVMSDVNSTISSAVADIIASFNSMISTLMLVRDNEVTFVAENQKLMALAISAVDGLTGAFKNLGSAALDAMAKVLEAAQRIAEAVNAAQASVTASPELKLQHSFESLENYLKRTNFDRLINQNFASALGTLTDVPAPISNTVSTSQIDNSVNTNITGANTQDKNNLASLIDQRVRVARGK